MIDTQMRRRMLAVFLAAVFLSWGAVLTFAGPHSTTLFSIADSKR
ncbi:MAG: hypothetical protein AAFR73_04790 [Pseudomonadota bacterium]